MSWLLYAISSEIADIWASNDPELLKFILLLKLFNPISLLTVERSLMGPLCFNNPSKVSNDRLRIWCVNFFNKAEKLGSVDNLALSIEPYDFSKWLKTLQS